MLTQEEKAEQWRARSAFDNEWGAEQETIRRVKRGEHVAVDRARFERLRLLAVAVDSKGLPIVPALDDIARARDALQPGDLDPLP